MDDLTGLSIQLGVPLTLLIVTYFTGRIVIGRHRARLEAGELEMRGVLVSDLRDFGPRADPSKPPALVVAEVVLSVDYFRSWIAKFFNIVGGEIPGLTSAASRARREAILRLQRQAVAQGHDALCNLRVDTCNVRGAEKANKRAGAIVVAAIASATAYTRAGA